MQRCVVLDLRISGQRRRRSTIFSCSRLFSSHSGEQCRSPETTSTRLRPLLSWMDFFKIVSYLLLLFTVVAFIAPYKVMIGGVILSVLVVCVTLIILGFSAMSSGFPPAKYFLVAWGSFLVGVMLYALKTGAILPSTALTNNGFQIGSALLVTLLALGMRARFEFLRSSGLG